MKTITCVVTFTTDDESLDLNDAAYAYLDSMVDQVCDENTATGVLIDVDVEWKGHPTIKNESEE